MLSTLCIWNQRVKLWCLHDVCTGYTILLMTKQLAIDFADLRYLEVTCVKCSTRQTVDCHIQNAHPPVACPCGVQFDNGAVQELIGFVGAYRTLSRANQKIRVRIIVDDAS